MANEGGFPDFVESTGYGTVTGLCGANCYHTFHPYILGTPTVYSEEELERLNEEENKKREYNGKEYTKYEATQVMRRLEAKMRKQRQYIDGLKRAGADKEDIKEARAAYQATSRSYKEFAKAMELPEERERVTMDGLGRV